MEFFYDDFGYPTIRNYSKEDSVLADFLLTDIQSDIYFMNEIEEIVLSILKKEIENWEGNMNIYSIRITQNGVFITNEYDESIKETYSLEKVFQTIKNWKMFIENIKPLN